MAFFRRKTYNKQSDQELIVLYKQSEDRNIIGEFYERYSHLVLGTSLKYLKDMTLAEDMTMKIFESLFDKLTKNDVSYFKGWLHMVTRNECLMLLRKRKFDHTSIEEHHVVQEDDDIDEKELDFTQLKTALNELKEDQRKCIQLFYIEGCCYEEISQELNIDFKKVKSHIQNGKRNLKIALSK